MSVCTRKRQLETNILDYIFSNKNIVFFFLLKTMNIKKRMSDIGKITWNEIFFNLINLIPNFVDWLSNKTLSWLIEQCILSVNLLQIIHSQMRRFFPFFYCLEVSVTIVITDLKTRLNIKLEMNNLGSIHFEM